MVRRLPVGDYFIDLDTCAFVLPILSFVCLQLLPSGPLPDIIILADTVLILSVIPGYLSYRYFGMRHDSAITRLFVYILLSAAFSVITIVLIVTILPRIGMANPLSQRILFVAYLGINGCLLYLIKSSRVQPISVRSISSRFGNRTLLYIITTVTLAAITPQISTQDNLYFPTVLFILLQLSLLIVIIISNRSSQTLKLAVIWGLGISLLWSYDLASPYIWGWDINYQYYVARRIVESNYWNPAARIHQNTVIISTVIPATYAIFSKATLVDVYRYVPALLFSIVPLGIYDYSKRVFEDASIVNLSAIFYMFFYAFFKKMPGKHHLAQIPLVFIILLIIKEHNDHDRYLLILAVALVTITHYTTGIVLAMLLLTILLSDVLFARRKDLFAVTILSILAPISWFIYSAQGLRFEIIVEVMLAKVSALLKTFHAGQLPSRTGANYAAREFTSFLWLYYKYANILVVASSGIGFLLYCYKQMKQREYTRYIPVSGFFLGFTGLGVFIMPGIGFDRILQLSLLALSPLVVYTVYSIQRHSTNTFPDNRVITVAVLVFAVSFALTSSGIAFHLSGEAPPRYAITVQDDPDWNTYTKSQVSGARWAKSLSKQQRIGILNPERYSWNTKAGNLLRGYYPPDRIIPIFRGEVESGAQQPDIVFVLNGGKICGSKLAKIYNSGGSSVLNPVNGNLPRDC